VGSWVRPSSALCVDFIATCGSGIHFHCTPKIAIDEWADDDPWV
jgi:hypothetical protein